MTYHSVRGPDTYGLFSLFNLQISTILYYAKNEFLTENHNMTRMSTGTTNRIRIPQKCSCGKCAFSTVISSMAFLIVHLNVTNSVIIMAAATMNISPEIALMNERKSVPIPGRCVKKSLAPADRAAGMPRTNATKHNAITAYFRVHFRSSTRYATGTSS